MEEVSFLCDQIQKLMWCSLLNMAPTSIKKRLTPISNNILAFQSPALSNVSFNKVVFLKVGIEKLLDHTEDRSVYFERSPTTTSVCTY